jgi:HlyD family secretion protein
LAAPAGPLPATLRTGMRTPLTLRRGVDRSALRGLAGAACLLALACESEEDLALVGTLERTQIELVAPVSEVIVEIAVRRGQEVEAGQTIVRLDPTLARLSARRAEAGLARARTADRITTQELDRLRQLRSTRVASDQAVERAELERDEAAAGLREAEANVDAASKQLRDLDLSAPGAAVVDQLSHEVGERVPAGSVLAVLLRKERPWVRVWLPEPYLARVGPGHEAEVSLDGWPGALRGRVLEVALEPTFTPHFALTERERAHLVYETRVELLDAPDGVRPGLPATVRLPVTRADPAPRPASTDRAQP